MKILENYLIKKSYLGYAAAELKWKSDQLEQMIFLVFISFPFFILFYWNRYVQFEESASNAEDAAVHCSAARETFVYLSTRDSHHLTNIKIAIVLQEWRENRERYLISDSDHEHWINLPILSSFFHKSLFFFLMISKVCALPNEKKIHFLQFRKAIRKVKETECLAFALMLKSKYFATKVAENTFQKRKISVLLFM